MPQSALRVAIVGTNDPRNVSGGRYHGLMLAYAIAAASGDAHVVTDHRPSFVADLEPLAPHRVQYHYTPDFVSGMPEGAFDWVLIVPTGIFLPEFYENCLDFAASAGARVGLINFESANWYNTVSNAPRDPALWEYWRRVCLRGGLVLSSARTSHRFAKEFYRAAEGCLRFEVWCPPINSVAARRVDGVTKDGSVLAFVRPQDAHKGSTALTQIDPNLFAGRTLRLIAGRDIPAEFGAAMQAHLAKAGGATLELLTRIPDLQKFRLLTAAQAVLFPSRFEGFGYPPVEAAYAGTESVCFRLPVLQETVGSIAHFAADDTMAAFSAALARALAQPERRDTLRQAVTPIADFDIAAALLTDILLRSADVVEPLARRRWRVAVGPWARTAARPFRPEEHAVLPPLPPYIRSARESTGRDILISAVAFLKPGTDRVEAVNPGGPSLPVRWLARAPADGFAEVDLYLIAPGGMAGRRITITSFRQDQPWGEPVHLQLDRVEPRTADLPVLCGISENTVSGSERMLRGWVLTPDPLTDLHFTPDGTNWFEVSRFTERRDVFRKYPGYASPSCEFRLHIPAETELDPQAARLLCLSSGVATDLLVGWSPAPKPSFSGTIEFGPEQAPPAPPKAPAPLQPQSAAAPAKTAAPTIYRAALGTLTLMDVTDAHWLHGIARRGDVDRLGAAYLRLPDGKAPALQPGMVLRFASGLARRIVKLEQQDGKAVAVLGAPLMPAGNGFPETVRVFDAADPAFGAIERSFSLTSWSDVRWFRNVWNQQDARYRRMFFMRAQLAAELGVTAGARLRFATSGERTVISTLTQGRDVQVLLDGTIRPVSDGSPAPIQVSTPHVSNQPGALPYSRGHGSAGWARGIRREGGQSRLLLETAAAGALTAGSLLRFADGTLARVLAAAPSADGHEVQVDRLLDPARHGHPGLVFPVDEADAPDGLPPALTVPGAGLTGKDPLYRTLIRKARETGDVMSPAIRPDRGGAPRALFVTVVPPIPASQGNRVVTRNLIQHLLGLGFEVDVVLQGWIDAVGALEAFDDRVRVFTVPFPRWEESEGARQRATVRSVATQFAGDGLDGFAAGPLNDAADMYHPYFIIRDETVRVAQSLFARHRYGTIMCNYTHSVRVVEELAHMAPLPPVCVITHDALSRLPRWFQGQRLDTSYRACLPGVERDVLDKVPGAVVVAISRSEAEYFRRIGVTNPVVLCEYDAAEEMGGAVIPEMNFDRRRIVFNGSANPMNAAGLNWFLDECWTEIVAAVPDVTFVVCGRVGASWNPGLANIEVRGELAREEMIALCSSASITINPCVAGTGLKIKTVEACCLGLPAVCLPTAVDGLEDVADQFAIVAADGGAFGRGCIELLTDRERWTAVRSGALAVAQERFSAGAVYRALDLAMGWKGLDLSARAASSAAPEPGLDAQAEELLRAGRQLAQTGQRELGWTIAGTVARRHRGDPAAAAAVAAAALDFEEPWAAVMHGTTVCGSRPENPEGYRLVAAGLLGLGMKDQALACLMDGALACGANNAAVLPGLVDLLPQLGRGDDAARLARLQPPSLTMEQYVPLDVFHFGNRMIRGWTVEANGSLTLLAGRASLRFVLMPPPKHAVEVAIDLLLPAAINSKTIRLTFDGHSKEYALGADRGLKTFRIPLPADRSGGGAAFQLHVDLIEPVGTTEAVEAVGVMVQPVGRG